MNSITGTLTPVATINGILSSGKQITAAMSVPEVIQTPAFTGEYTYTPSAEAQTIEIDGLRALSNITINAIPDNYGLIAWNGSILTVS